MLQKVRLAISSAPGALSQRLPPKWATHPLMMELWRYMLLRFDRSLDDEDRSLLMKVDMAIHAEESMGAADPGHYLHVGLSAVRCIDAVLGRANVEHVGSVLDFPSGSGRVLRFLAVRFPDATLTAGDLDEKAVTFCAATFGAAPVFSSENFSQVRLRRDFDLIWCGSLMTHVDSQHAVDLLRLLSRALRTRGVLTFTTLGEHAAEKLRSGAKYRLIEKDVAAVLDQYSSTGFGYADYPGESSYGLSLISPGWVRRQIAEIGTVREVYYGPHAWDHHQDVWGVVDGGV
jgi:SAM-dependent methyltransferase